MGLDVLKEALPEYAKDLKLNLSVIGSSTALKPAQAWGAALATAIASRNPQVVREVAADAGAVLTQEEVRAASAAAAIMAMNNVYYRSMHMLGGDYDGMPARLRMQIIGNPGVDQGDFELWCLAVSAVNGCDKCLTSHERVVLDKGMDRAGVQDAVRIAAVIHAVAVTLEATETLAPAQA